MQNARELESQAQLKQGEDFTNRKNLTGRLNIMSQKLSDIKRAIMDMQTSVGRVNNALADCKKSADNLVKNTTRKRTSEEASIDEMQAYLDARFGDNNFFKMPRDESFKVSSDKENDKIKPKAAENPQRRTLHPRYS